MTSMGMPASLLLLGCGKMGGAMLEGWLAAGLRPDHITVLEPHPSPRLQALAGDGLRLNPPAAELAAAEVVLLAIKPQTLDEAAATLDAVCGRETLLVSVVAGKTIANLVARAPRVGAVVRTIPNTPSAVGRGITACFPSPAVSEAQRAMAGRLLSAIGRVEWLDREELIDAATAVSGSGPAYAFLLAECMAAAGAALGLPADVAARLARATVEGAGELMYQDAATDPATLRRNVTSPAGTTAAALAVLMAEDGLQPLVTRAVAAACRRAGELSG
jgi:pyrroline-5-carboxylate reductase